MRRAVTVALAATIALAGLTGTAYAPLLPGTCVSSPSKGTPATPVSVQTVRYGTIDSFRVTTTGAQSAIAIHSVGDVDLGVCKAGAAPACTSTNPAGVVDACVVAAGTWIVMVAHCFGGPEETFCDYFSPAPAPRVDLPYVLAYGP